MATTILNASPATTEITTPDDIVGKLDCSSICPEWNSSSAYKIGSTVTYNGSFFRLESTDSPYDHNKPPTDDSQSQSWTEVPFRELILESINVKDFGATGDGETNDLVAIQAAINFAGQTGQCVFFPPGRYVIGEYGDSNTASETSGHGINIPSGVKIYGCGDSSVVIQEQFSVYPAASNPERITSYEDWNCFYMECGVHDVEISNIRLEGPFCGDGQIQYKPLNTGIIVRGRDYQFRTDTRTDEERMATIVGDADADPYEGESTNIRIQNVSIEGFGYSGIEIDNVTDAWVTNCIIKKCAANGIRVYGGLRCHINGNTIKDIWPGDILNSREVTIKDKNTDEETTKSVGGNRSYGITFTRKYYQGCRVSSYCEACHNIVEGSINWKGIDTHGGTHLDFIDNLIKDCHIGIGIDKGGTGGNVSFIGKDGTKKYDKRNQGIAIPSFIKVVGNTIIRNVPDVKVDEQNKVNGEIGEGDSESGTLLSCCGPGIAVFAHGVTEQMDMNGHHIIVSNNLIDGFGEKSRFGAITYNNWVYVSHSNNVIRNSRRSAICLMGIVKGVFSGDIIDGVRRSPDPSINEIQTDDHNRLPTSEEISSTIDALYVITGKEQKYITTNSGYSSEYYEYRTPVQAGIHMVSNTVDASISGMMFVNRNSTPMTVLQKRVPANGYSGIVVSGGNIFKNEETGEVQRYEIGNGKVVNVMDYGAMGDGKTNDLVPIQKAFDAAAAIGGKVVFPTATYLVDYSNVNYACLIIKNGIREIDFQGSKILFRVNQPSQWQSACFWMNRTEPGHRVETSGIETRDGKLSYPCDGACDITIKNVFIENIVYNGNVQVGGQNRKTLGQMWRAFVCMDQEAHDIRFENVSIKSNSLALMKDGTLLGGCNLIYLTGKNISLHGLRIDCAPEPQMLNNEKWGIRDTVAVQFGWVDNLNVSDFHIVSGDCCLDFHYSTEKQKGGVFIPSQDINVSNGVMTSKEHSAMAFGCWTTNKDVDHRNISTQRVVVDSVSFDRCCGCIAISDGRSDRKMGENNAWEIPPFVPCKDFLFTGCMISADSTPKPNSFYGLVSVFHNLAYNFSDESFSKDTIIEGLKFDGCRFIDYQMTAQDGVVLKARPAIYIQSAKDIEFSGCSFDIRETRFTSYESTSRYSKRNASMAFFDVGRIAMDSCDIRTDSTGHLIMVDNVDELEVTDCSFRLSPSVDVGASIVLSKYSKISDDIEIGGARNILLADNITSGRKDYIYQTTQGNKEVNGSVLLLRIMDRSSSTIDSIIEKDNISKELSKFVTIPSPQECSTRSFISNVADD